MGKTIRDLRLKKGLSQGDVAKICNITTPAVSKWERGESIPDISSLESLSTLFGVTINKIINSKAEINVTTSKHIVFYRIAVAILSVCVIVFVIYGVSNYATFIAYLNDNEQLENLENDPILSSFQEQSSKPYHLYFEATEHQLVQGNVVKWIHDIFIQEPDLFDYFTGDEHPNLNDILINTTDFIRRNNETSTIEIIWDRSDGIEIWDLDVTYYDIENDDDYSRLNAMGHTLSNGNQYDFSVFDSGYFAIYELIDGNTVYDNYYFHMFDMSPIYVEDNIQIDFELNKLGIDIIFTDQFDVTRYHYILTDYDSSRGSWFFQYYMDVYLRFPEELSGSELRLMNFTDNNGAKEISFQAFQDDQLIWDPTFYIHDYLIHEIYVEELDYDIQYQMQNDGLLHIVFIRKSDGHIMSYKLLPNEINTSD
ncbi:MAG: helix-turn-helix domain-containing protein [Candidatus Izemoplasmataceae bacterium]